nr:MAG TPA: repressor domain protein [Bacteriophage sp.]
MPEGKEKILNQLEIFKNREFGEIRTVTVDGEPWFVAKDIAEILQYTNTQKAIRDHVDEEDKLTERIVLSGQNREVICINESGLYSLILSSKMSGAKSFKRWVTSEVLPQIRRTGTYQKPMTPQEMMRVQLGMIDGHEERITHLENTMTIDYEQQQELKKTVNKRVIEVLGGKKALAYKEMSKKVFSECNHDIQDYFRVNSRNNIPTKRYQEAVEYVEGWNPSNNTILEIRSCNVGMGGVNGV